MKRQRGRGRKPGGGGGGGHHHQHQGNRSLESTGPDVKIRGTAAQIYEKYAQYARDAQSGGDRVRYETYLQHAEHYFRVMAATMPRDRMFPQQGPDGQPMPPQQGGEERSQGQGENVGGGGGEQQALDPMKVVDDGQGGDDDGDYEGDDEGDDQQDGERVEARNDGQGDNQNNQNNQQGRRRRRGRRNRHHDQNYNQSSNNLNTNNDGGNANNNDPEARSALDSLARKQGAFAND